MIINIRMVWLLNLPHGIFLNHNIETKNIRNYNEHIYSNKTTIITKIIWRIINNDIHMNNISNSTNTFFTNKNTIINIMMLNKFSTPTSCRKQKIY